MKELDFFKLLSDENRFKIFVLLLTKEMCICEIEEILQLKQANVSKHMIKFKSLNLVDIRKDAQWVYYKIKDQVIDENKQLIDFIKESKLANNMKEYIKKQNENLCKNKECS